MTENPRIFKILLAEDNEDDAADDFYCPHIFRNLRGIAQEGVYGEGRQ